MDEMEGLALVRRGRQGGERPALVKQQAQCRDLVATVGEGSGGKRDGMLAQYCIRFIMAGSKLGTNEYRLFRRLAGTTWCLLLGDGLSGASLNRSCKS
jgi:hypothetical protein